MSSLFPSLWRRLRRRTELRKPRQSQMEKLEDRLLLAATPVDLEQQQHFAYLLNQARTDPAGAAKAWGLHAELEAFEPRAPLALHDSLTSAARTRAADFASQGMLGLMPGPETPASNALVRTHGYPLPAEWPDAANFVELVAAGNTVPDARAALEQWLGDHPAADAVHRQQLLGQGPFDDSRHLGVGVVPTELQALRDYWVVEVARPDQATPTLTGVVYHDANQNRQYDPGEGLAGVVVSVGNRQVRTDEAGGWSLAVEPGVHTIQVQGGAFFGTARARVDVGQENVAVDFISGRSAGIVQFNRWRNSSLPGDVNGDGRVTPFDALLLVSALHASGGERFNLFDTNLELPQWFPDVSGDRRLTPFDVLLVVGALQAEQAEASEDSLPHLMPASPIHPARGNAEQGEGSGHAAIPAPVGLSNEFLVNTMVPRVQATGPGAAEVAASASGYSVMVYAGVGPVDRDGVYARRFDSTGTPLGDAFLVNSTITGSQNSPLRGHGGRWPVPGGLGRAGAG